MYRAAQRIRTAAVVIGYAIIIVGILNQVFKLILFLEIDSNQFQEAASTESFISRLVSSLSMGLALILIALILNPEKVAPLLAKRESSSESLPESLPEFSKESLREDAREKKEDIEDV